MKRRTRRWGRILFNTLTAISLLLAIATAGLWVRSIAYEDAISFRRSGSGNPYAFVIQLGTGSGRFVVTLLSESGSEGQPLSAFVLDDIRSVPTQETWIDRAWPGGSGFAYSSNKTALFQSIDAQLIQFPLWIFLVPTSIAPMLCLRKWIRGRNERPGLCPACGYDTRANPAKCSECGHEMSATTEVESAWNAGPNAGAASS